MDPKRLAYLIDICKTPEATAEEVEELEKWYNSFDLEADILESFSEKELQSIRSDIWQGLTEKKGRLSPATQVHPLFRSALLKAAVLLMVFSAGLYVYLQRESPAAAPVIAKTELVIPPGADRAVLTLDNGTQIDLNGIAIGEEIRESGIRILKEKDGSISYLSEERSANSEIPFNTVSTPRGGQYRVTLPDGSAVWLNAASSIRYPTAFNESERVVYLTGEAYFEIAKSQTSDGANLPFTVVSSRQEVQVLGTHFNVKAYEDEKATVTTLLEGKVRLVGTAEGDNKQEDIFLQVGESASWDRSTFKVRRGEADKAVAWKNGRFLFSGENIKEIMKGLSRWYNVEVSYQGDLRNVNFAGSLSRYDNINEVLKKLELTGTVKFEIRESDTPHGKERRVVVMP